MSNRPPVSQVSAPGLGILMMVVATLLLTVQDAIAKWMTSDFHVGEILFYRGLWAYLPIALFAWREGGLSVLRARRPGTNALRAAMNLGAGLLVISAYALMPLAEVLAITFASPLIVTALAAPMLGEPVGWRRWAAVLVGFGGVLVMVRPAGAGFDPVILLPLGVAVMIALRDLLTRRLGAFDSSTTILFYTVTVSVIGGAAVMAVLGTRMPQPFEWLLFAVSGIINGGAHYLAISAFRFAEAATLAPLRYLSLVFATAIGFVVWGDVPGPWVVVGAAVVVASGLYIIHREARLRRHGRPDRVPPGAPHGRTGPSP